MSTSDNLLRISWLFDAAGVSKSGYYEWKAKAQERSKREEADRRDFELVLEAYNYRGYKKGSRSIYMRLLHQGIVMNRKKIRRLMKKYNLICPIRRPNPYRALLRAEHENRTFPNILDRRFKEYGPRKVLLTDITYLYYGNNQRVYLSVVKDAYTNECLAHKISASLKLNFVLDTFSELIETYGDSIPSNALVHSDQGAHYTSIRFSKLIEDNNILRSMSRKANCWDNAPQESFFGHMKDEINVKIRACKNIYQVKEVINDWVDYYNNDRYQWNLAKLAPHEYYEYCLTGNYPQKGGSEEKR